MSLLTAHKIFIAGATALFLLYALWELRHYLGGDPSALPLGSGAALAAIASAVYLRRLWTRPPGPRAAHRHGQRRA